jgi:hypothetical protein
MTMKDKITEGSTPLEALAKVINQENENGKGIDPLIIPTVPNR